MISGLTRPCTSSLTRGLVIPSGPANTYETDGALFTTGDILGYTDSTTKESFVDTFSASFWVQFASVAGANGVFISLSSSDTGGLGFLHSIDSGSKLAVRQGDEFTPIVDTLGTTTIAAGTVYHCLYSQNGVDKRHFYINDVDQGFSDSWAVHAISVPSDYFILSASAANIDMAEIWMTDEYIDFDITANRRKFADANGKPVDLGGQGETPTGTAALYYHDFKRLSNPAIAWNRGVGGFASMVSGTLDISTVTWEVP